MNYVNKIMKDKYELYTNMDFKIKKNLKVEKVYNGFVLPINKHYNPNNTLLGSGGVLDEEQNYIEISAQKGYNMSDRLDGKYKFDMKNVEVSDNKVIYLNAFIHHWGHFLIDVIGRLWYILKNDINDYKIVYTCIKGKEDKINGNYLELLELLGIDKSKLMMVNKVTRFKEIIVPEMSIYPGKYFTEEYEEIFNRIVSNVNISEKKERKIYCSRSRLKRANKIEIGENIIENIFNQNGYVSVYFEDMSVREQIQTINEASEIVAISGTLPHNLLFAKTKIKMVILNKTYKLNLHQFIINQISKANVDFVDIDVSPMPVLYGVGPFIMRVTDNLKKYCENNNLKCEENVYYKISVKEKIWYAFRYLLYYRGKIIKDADVSIKELRNFYKDKQRINKGE